MPCFLSLVVGGEDMLADAEDHRDIAARPHLMVLRADPRLLAGQHLGRALRVDEDLEPLFPDRVEGDDLDTALRGFLQRVEKARAVRARVLTEEEHRVAFGEIVEHHRADADADHFLQRDRCRLVAHVRAVGQIVVAIEPREQRIEVGRLKACAPGGVEDDGLRIERLAARSRSPRRPRPIRKGRNGP